MTATPLRRVSVIEVERLFDLYDHRVDLNLAERTTILHGPNGVGKTMILKMVRDIIAGRYGIFRQVPFRRFGLSFDDGTCLELVCEQSRKGSKGKRNPALHMSLARAGKVLERLEISPQKDDLLVRAGRFSTRVPWLRRLGDEEWIDERDGHLLSAEEVLMLYSEVPYSESAPAIRERERSPDPLGEFRRAVVVHFIEAQRLLRFVSESAAGYRQSRPNIFRVLDCARGLQEEISRTMAQYGQQSQQLDQSFPQRLLRAGTPGLSAGDLKSRMDELDRKRSALKDIGLLDKPEVHPFDTNALDTLDGAQQAVMSLYVQDTTEKLDVLTSLEQRARLLLDNVNQKFLHKRIRLDREAGLVAEREDGTPLKLEALSSGEQHELVLHYDLLFRVAPNTLVLIDEPELSLHVAWQKRFLPDLLEIVDTARFDVVIATHSPFIVGDRSDLMIGLDAEPGRR